MVHASVAMNLFRMFLPWRNHLAIGYPLPDVTVPDQNGNAVNLAREAAHGFTLVYFYPRASTPGCTAQACSLRDSYHELQERGVRIFGVSTDSVEAQKKFQTRQKLPFQLLADKDSQVISAFGVPAFLGFAMRQAYLFRDGKLVWLDRSASTSQQAKDVLAVLDRLKP